MPFLKAAKSETTRPVWQPPQCALRQQPFQPPPLVRLLVRRSTRWKERIRSSIIKLVLRLQAAENQVSGLPRGSADTTNADVSHGNLPTSDTNSTLTLGIHIRILLLYKRMFLSLKLSQLRKTPFPMNWKILSSCTYCSPSHRNTWVPTPPRRIVPFFNTLVFQILVLQIECKLCSSNPQSAEILILQTWHARARAHRPGRVLSPLWALESSCGSKRFGENTSDILINKHKCSLYLRDRLLPQNQKSPLSS